ncbi:MAG TPA: DUF72 domain-containing protein [Patescibacteria group bacterium]|nr:DUF72 domain-containing protein [Patescibacteria group bacterium]
MKIIVGTSGFNYKSWRGDFYPAELPQTEWLKFYASKFNSVEINNSFYVTVKPATYKNWNEQTPSDFQFVVKGHRFITQLKKLKDVEDSVDLFFKNAKPLGSKLKVVLWQFPANFSNTPEHFERLQRFVKVIPQTFKHAFEFRDKSWFAKDVESLLSKNNSTLVISQSSKFPEIEMTGKSLVYIRFHGPRSLYSSNYSDAELKSWSQKIKEYEKKMECFAYFNNDNGGYATKNALRLKELVGS